MIRDELTWETPLVELLLCAADLARCGAPYGLTAAVDFFAIPMPGSDVAMVASFEALSVALEWGESGINTNGLITADAYLEAAYRVLERRGVSS